MYIADPHRGNLLRTPEGKLAFIDFGMMADVTEEERYGLIGLAIGLQNKDLSLVTENLLKVCTEAIGSMKHPLTVNIHSHLQHFLFL